MGRYSNSKIEAFKQCPQKYFYNYVEDLNAIEESINLTVGKLFHSALEATTNFEDPKPFFDEFASLVRSGQLKGCSEDTLKKTVEEYLKFYYDQDKDNEVLYVEEKFEHLTAETDVISGMFDIVFRRNDNVYIRDYKTTINKLKYDLNDVTFNRQLNLYSKILEDDYGIPNQYLEIDEVLIHNLDPVPLNADGTPSTDKSKLAFVTLENYMAVLESLGLESDAKYYYVIKLLQDRGHPLFKRITVPVNSLTRENIYAEFMTIIKMVESNKPYRVKGPLCDYCAFQEICNLELQGGSDTLVESIKKSRFKPSE